MQLLKIATKEQATAFAKQWKHRNIHHIIDEVHASFAADFANVIVTSFVENQMARAKAAAAPQVALAGEYAKVSK
jgi:hypothetical protein